MIGLLTSSLFFQSLQAEVSRLGDALTADLKKAEWLLNSANNELIPIQIKQDLDYTYRLLESNLADVSQMCAERRSLIVDVMKEEKVCVTQKAKSGNTQTSSI